MKKLFLLNDGAKRNRLLYVFENHVYTSKKNLTFARNFVTTPFLGGFFFLKLHKQKFARNFVATPFLGGSFLSYALTFARNFVLGGSFFS